MAPKEVDEALRRRHVGANGVRRPPAIVLEMIAPARPEFTRRMRA
jgi:hypothetical protein